MLKLLAFQVATVGLVLGGCASQANTPTTQPERAVAVALRPSVRAAGTTVDFRQVVRQAKDKVFPAVVYIKCIRESHESGKKQSQEVTGSGVLVSADGELVTNWHVVDKAINVRCLLLDGRAFEASVVGTDKDTDLALIRLKLPAGAAPAPFAVLGEADPMQEGDFVMAIGAPWGLSRSVSIGIVSCVQRYLPGNSEYSLWLQTDASISPGNSGGPLVNTDGKVIGITTLGVMYGGDMGFAIPAETVRRVVAQLRQNGLVKWSWTGIQLQPLRDFNRNMYFDAAEGVLVASTDPDSPARQVGVQPKDRIVRVNGQAVTSVTEEGLPAVRRLLGQLPLNQPAGLELVRDNQLVRIELTPREKGKVEGEELDCPRWDMTVKTINQFDNPELHYYRAEGVFIFGVKYPGNASNAGLQSSDIVLKIEGKEVKALADVSAIHKTALENVKTNPRIVFTILRSGLMRQVVMDFQRDYEKE